MLSNRNSGVRKVFDFCLIIMNKTYSMRAFDFDVRILFDQLGVIIDP